LKVGKNAWRRELVPGRDGLVLCLSFEEAGEEIARVGGGLGLKGSVGCSFAFGDAGEAEAYDGVHGDGLEALEDGVLGPEPVDPRDLRDLIAFVNSQNWRMIQSNNVCIRGMSYKSNAKWTP
jgi:hypothetical protein